MNSRPVSTDARAMAPTAAAASPAQWLHPSAAIRIGSGAMETSRIARLDPEITEATSSAAAAPAAIPTVNICTMRCPARRAVRDGSQKSVPTWRRKRIFAVCGLVSRFGSSLHFAAHSRANFRIKATLGSIMIFQCGLDLKFLRRGRHKDGRNFKSTTLARARPSADHVGQEAEEPGALDGAREFALLLGRHRRDPARDDLATLGHVALQELDVLVVDLGGVGAGKRAGLAAAEERPAGRQLGEAHGLFLRRLGFVAVVARPASFALAAAFAPALLAVAVTIRLAHHGRRPGLVLVDAHREIAQDILVEALLALDLGQRRGRRIDVHEGEMRLAILAQAVAQRFEAPVFGLAERAAHLFDDALELGGQLIDLLRRHVLTRQVHVLIEWHETAFPFSCRRSGAKPLEPFGKARTLEMRGHGTPGRQSPAA